MDLRRFHLIGLCWCSAHAALAAHGIATYPLDEGTVYTIRISRDVPTTCVFPGVISAVDGAHVSAKVEEGAEVLLSASPNTPYFSVRALKADATGALNVVFRGRVYVLCLVGGKEADRAVKFVDPRGAHVGAARRRAIAHEVIERARDHARFAAQYPELTAEVDYARPGSVTTYPGFTATLAEVFQYDAEEVLVFHVRLQNRTTRSLRYDAAGVAVRVGAEVFPAEDTEASGAIPPQGHSELWFAVTGMAEEGRTTPSVHEDFHVVVPTV